MSITPPPEAILFMSIPFLLHALLVTGKIIEHHYRPSIERDDRP